MSYTATYLGHGVGLRSRHYGHFLEAQPPVAWVEATSENFMVGGGRPVAVLEKVRRDAPVGLHGVSLSVGAVEPLDRDYLVKLRALVDWLEPASVSDHLCWGRHRGRYVHDLLPLPYTEEALAHVVGRVSAVQDVLGRQLLLENVSSYVAFSDSTLTEWEFLGEVAKQADCGILLDINNVFVSAYNHDFDARAYLDGIPAERVAQFHLAGHRQSGTYLIDTHDGPVSAQVWALYREAVARFGRVSTLVEWDDDVPELEILLKESQRAARFEAEALVVFGAEA